MKALILSGVALAAFAMASSARADYAFSGTGSSGKLVGSSESWTFGFDGGTDWGSPGVGAGVVAYGETQSAYGMIVNFSGGGVIDPGSILTGNGKACIGSSGGGTTFCTIGSPNDIWEAFLVSPTSIEFLAQSPTFYLRQAQSYFVNVFFDGADPTSFTGKWLTEFTPTVPEPASMALFGAGIAALGLVMRRRTAASV